MLLERMQYTLCHESNCSCEGYLSNAQTFNIILKDLGHDHLDLLLLDAGGEETNIIQGILDSAKPRHLLVEVHDPESDFSKLSKILMEYNLVNAEARYGTWKLQRFVQTTSEILIFGMFNEFDCLNNLMY